VDVAPPRQPAPSSLPFSVIKTPMTAQDGSVLSAEAGPRLARIESILSEAADCRVSFVDSILMESH